MHALYYQMKIQKSKSEIQFDDYYRNIMDKIVSDTKDIFNKCRVCLQVGKVSIYGNEFTETITQVFQGYNINLDEQDGYPKHLCAVCFKFIKTAALFRKTAKYVDDILKREVKEEIRNLDPTDEHSFSEENDSEKESNEKWNAELPQTNDKRNAGLPQTVKKERKKKVDYNAKVTCHICNKVINRSYYKVHVTMHDPDHKKYVCDKCGKSFRLRCAYHNHSLRHRTDFPYKCQFCPYRGRYVELLKTHMRTHTGDYRYMCTECPARFLFKSNLNRHMQKHKEPKFKCDNCKRAFHTKLMLQKHFEADHLGIKNHVCGICGKAFGYRHAMMKHQRHVHKREKQMFGRMPAYLQAGRGE